MARPSPSLRQLEDARKIVMAGLAAGTRFGRVRFLPDGSVSVDELQPQLPGDVPATDFMGQKPGKVYLVGFDRWVKIGFTVGEVRRRMAALQTSLPVPLVLIASLDGTYSTENGLHRRFAHLRASGEWFRREGSLAAWIDEGCPL